MGFWGFGVLGFWGVGIILTYYYGKHKADPDFFRDVYQFRGEMDSVMVPFRALIGTDRFE